MRKGDRHRISTPRDPGIEVAVICVRVSLVFMRLPGKSSDQGLT